VTVATGIFLGRVVHALMVIAVHPQALVGA
jgi:hypothetical protein